MWLENSNNLFRWVLLTCCIKRCNNFSWMVGKVIDDNSTTDNFLCETAFNTWEGFKVFRNQAHVKTGYIEVPNNRSCIQDIVTTIGWHMEFSKDLSIMFHLEIRPCRCTHNVCCYKVIIFFETIVIDWRIGCNLTKVWILTVNKESFLHLLSIIIKGREHIIDTCKVIRMVKVNVSDDWVCWVVWHEMTFIFIRLKDKVLRISRTSPSSVTNKIWRVCDIFHNMWQETCCRSLTMCTCHTKASELIHEVTQELVITLKAVAIFNRISNFNVVIFTKGISSNQFNIFCDVFFIERKNRDTCLLKTTLSEVIFFHIWTLNLVSHLVEHQSQSWHTRSFNSNKMISFWHSFSLQSHCD